MSSREIAELTGKDHRHVLRDIDAMMTALGLDREGYAQNWTHPQNRATYRGYTLPKDLTLTLVAGYSVPLRHRIVARWIELESHAQAGKQPAIPTSFREALLLAAEQQEIIERQAAQIALDAPKVHALDRIAIETRGAVSLRVAAKIAQVPEKSFIAFLLEQRWLYRPRDGVGLLGFADKERAGLIEMKRVEVPRSDGPPKAVARALLTQRGLAKAVELIERKAPHLRKRPEPGGTGQLALPMTPPGEAACGPR